jgi:hypothetical protein
MVLKGSNCEKTRVFLHQVHVFLHQVHVFLHLHIYVFIYFARNNLIMNNSFQDFLSQPLWLTIPMVIVYLGLIAYIIYFVWTFRKRK